MFHNQELNNLYGLPHVSVIKLGSLCWPA